MSSRYIILTNKENPSDIINRCIAANIPSVVLDATKKCLAYYKELGPDARVAVSHFLKSLRVDDASIWCNLPNELSFPGKNDSAASFSRTFLLKVNSHSPLSSILVPAIVHF